MSDKVIADLKQKVMGILGKEVINVDPSNDGGPGDTFEKLLGVKLNNLPLPDFGGVVELKTGKLASGMTKQSFLTLFHRNPLPTKGYTKATNSLILEAVGWNHSGLCNPRKKGKKCKSRKINGHLQETDQLYTTGTDGFKRSTGRCYPMGEKSFRSTTYFTKTGYKNGAKASSRGLYLDIVGDFLIMDFDPLLVDTKKKTRDDVGKFFQHTYQDWLNDISTRTNPHYSNVFPVRYKIADLYNDYVNKLSNALFCTYKQSGGSMKKIIFQEAYLLGNPVSIEKFKTLLKTGALVVDFDQRTTHDHGTKLRLKPDHIPVLFDSVENLSTKSGVKLVNSSTQKKNELKYTRSIDSVMDKDSLIDVFRKGDCIARLKELPDKVFDFALTSPPYNLKNSTGNGMKDGRGGKWENAKLVDGYADYDDNMPHDEYVKWQREIITEAMRVLKDDGAFFYNHKWRVQGGLLQDRADILDGFPVRQIIIWQRSGGINFNKGYFLPTYEVIYVIAKKGFKLEKGANKLGDIWTITQDIKNPHPASFPLELAMRVVKSCPGDFVLDPFMGSGTTAAAAKLCGKNFFGIELSDEYISLAKERIEHIEKHGSDINWKKKPKKGQSTLF